MSLERWQQVMRGVGGEDPRPTFYWSDPVDVRGTVGVQYRYVVVQEGDICGLAPGMYVHTNVTPTGYEADPGLRMAIRSQVTQELMDKKQTPSIGQGEELDLLSAIFFTPCAIAGNTIVLSIRPALPSEVDSAFEAVVEGHGESGLFEPQQ